MLVDPDRLPPQFAGLPAYVQQMVALYLDPDPSKCEGFEDLSALVGLMLEKRGEESLA